MKVRYSLTTRLLLIVMIPIILGSTLLFGISVRLMRQVFEQGYQNSAAIIVQTLDSGIGSIENLHNKTNLQNQILKLTYNNPEIVWIQVKIIDEKGELITFVSSESQITSTEEVKQPKGILGYFGQYSGAKSEFVSELPIEIGGKKVGTYEVALSYADTYNTFIKQIYYFLIGSLLLFLIMMGMIWYLSKKQIINPIKSLIVGTEKIGAGDFASRLNIDKSDEIGQLAIAINITAEKLDKYYDNLEGKVSEKTESLNNKLLELDAKNTQMNKSEVAMLNILEDSRELEKQLAEEKKGVEEKVVERTKQLKDEEAKLMASISALPPAFIIFDVNGKVVVQNGKLEGIVGKIEGEWSIETISMKLGEKLGFETLVKQTIEAKKTNLVEGAIDNKFIRVFTAPVTSGDDELIGVLITIEDISEARILERSKDEFFSIASHELRTPLTAIRGNTSMMLDYYKDAFKDPELKQMMDDVHEGSVRLIGIVNDFLDMSRLEMGKVEYKIESVNLLEIVEKVVKDLAENAKLKGVELKTSGDANVVVQADLGKVEQILFNMVGNSLKFTDKGSVTVNVAADYTSGKIEIADTGKGIPVANQGLLFHKFQQAGKSLMTREGAKGTGLGLYISRLMAEGMGGKLELIKSEEGKGSVFGINLPLKT